MQYLTFEEYASIGGTNDLTAFLRTIDRACSIINTHTYGRVNNMSRVPNEVKSLCRDLTDYLIANTDTITVVSSKSQSAGGVSESESYVNKTPKERTRDIRNMIREYLASCKDDSGTPLLFQGVSE